MGILHRLFLCSGILYWPDLYPRILMPQDPCSRMPQRPDLCPRILDKPHPSVPSNGPDRRLIIFQSLRPCILRGLYRLGLCLFLLRRLRRLDLCPCIFLGGPGLKLLQQGSGWWLVGFSQALIGGLKSGGSLVAGCCARCGRHRSLSVSG